MLDHLWNLLERSVVMRQQLEADFADDLAPFDVALSRKIDLVIDLQTDLADLSIRQLNAGEREAA